MNSTLANNNAVIQSLLQRADQMTNAAFGVNSSVTILGQDQHSSVSSVETTSRLFHPAAGQRGLKIEEVDAATASQMFRPLSPSSLSPQQQFVDADSTSGVATDESAASYTSELYQDPNGPQIIHRPPLQGPVTYRQNVSVRFLQPPPIPPPGPLIIKEVRPPQLPAPPPLIIRQRAPPPATPPPLILRERPPQIPSPIPAQTIIKRLPPTPPPPRSIIIERFPAQPARPREIIIERWLPYPQETQRRRIITHRAAPPCPYPPPRNIIIVHEPVRVNVVRQVHRLGIQPQNPLEYIHRYGATLLDTTTLLTHVQHIGVTDDLGPPLNSFNQSYQAEANAEYYVNQAQTVWQPEYDYTRTTAESQVTNNSDQSNIYWANPQEDIHSILQRLGLPLE